MHPKATRFRERIFGTDISLTGLSHPAAALQRLRDIEASLSRFDPESDLSILNRSRSGSVPPAFLSLLLEAVSWMNRTGGLVSPFLGRVIVSLGYDRDFSELTGCRNLSQNVDSAESRATVRIDVGTGWVELPDGVDIDLGGFAKGWAADLIRTGDGSPAGLANIGGDLRVWSAGDPWQIVTDGGVVIELAHGAVATSSTRRRSWSTTGGRMHHLIDPRTGQPSATDCAEATVIAGSGLAAEVLAKLAVLSGMAGAPTQLTALDPTAGWILTDTAGHISIGGTLPSRSDSPPRRNASL